MKKIAIAGASVVLAALPVVGAFAANPAAVEDTLTVTVNESCLFNRTTGNGAYSKSMSMNAVDLAFASSTFTANCNNAKGYTISAAFTSLTGAGDAITYSATTPTQGSGTWTAQIGDGDNIAATNGVLGDVSTADPVDGRTYTVNYKVSTHTYQASGTYTGKATYTLAQKTQ